MYSCHLVRWALNPGAQIAISLFSGHGRAPRSHPPEKKAVNLTLQANIYTTVNTNTHKISRVLEREIQIYK
jgi:hypothetical protein